MTPQKSRWYRPLAVLVACGILLSGTSTAWALITGAIGNDPTADQNWPQGALALANLKTRLGWWEGPPFGGGEYHFLYRGDAAALNEALDVFSKIDAPVLQVDVHSGPEESFWLAGHAAPNPKDPNDPQKAKLDSRIDWAFVIWTPASYHRLFNHPQSIFSSDQENYHQPLPAPKLDIYVGDGLVQWKDVKLPKNVRVMDHRVGRQADVKTASMTGKVYNLVTSKPVSQAIVSLTRQDQQGKPVATLTTQTDKHGDFEFQQIPAADRHVWHRMSVESEGLAARDLGHRAFEPGSQQHLIAYLSPLQKVTGRVLNDQNQPLAGAEVMAFSVLSIDGKGYASKDRPTVKTDAQGWFTLELPQGFAQLSCRVEHLQQKESLKLHETSRRDLVLEMETTSKVTIRLINDQNKPLTDKVVALEPKGDPIGKWGGMRNTDADGTVTFEGVPPGEYVIRPDGPNGKHTKSVTIRGGKPVEISFTTK